MIYEPESLEFHVLLIASDDWIQLADVVSTAHFDVGIEKGEPLFVAVQHCLSELLHQGFVLIGELNASGETDNTSLAFQAWTGSPESTIARVIGEWRALGRWPDLNEICWLDLTSEGIEFARALTK